MALVPSCGSKTERVGLASSAPSALVDPQFSDLVDALDRTSPTRPVLAPALRAAAAPLVPPGASGGDRMALYRFDRLVWPDRTASDAPGRSRGGAGVRVHAGAAGGVSSGAECLGVCSDGYPAARARVGA